MNAIRNADGKIICRADAEERLVEIKYKETITTISFLDDGSIEVSNRTAYVGSTTK